MKIIDATNLILGRLGARVAKDLLNGEEVTIINPDKIIISGSIERITEKYLEKRRMQNKANPAHTPVWPRTPHMLLKKIISGMMPKKTVRGKQALSRLRVMQPGLAMEGAATIKEIDGSEIERKTTLGAVCSRLGWNAN
ncbi:MAG: 50S ribosomal protein L13 [Candidatus Micrarchaeia archaeon]